MTKYKQSLSQSAELLRRVLPLMTKQAAAFHPMSYTLWYEYTAGINRQLKNAIDEKTANGAVLDEEAVSSLHQQCVAELDEETTQRIRATFQSALENMAKSAALTGNEATQFGGVLQNWMVEMKANPAIAIASVSKILGDTNQMQSAIASLNKRLDESQNKIEELRRDVENAKEKALVDELTGLTNRRGFDSALDACLSAYDASEAVPCLLMTDIDHFKTINDTYGHLLGDKVIKAVAQVLKENLKGRDLAARYGGEEFVILLPGTPIEGAGVVAEKIRDTIERSRIRRSESNEEIARITMSFGVAAYRPGETAIQFIERVDNALYKAKHQGRNQVCLAVAEVKFSSK